MDYTSGAIGRVFVARIDHDEDLLAELVKLARSEEIKQAFFMLIGAVKNMQVVTGPKEDTVPPDPMWHSIAGACEILGIGNILWKDGDPSIHLHAALGKGGDVTVGCLRDSADAYLTTEAVIFEISGIAGERVYDNMYGIARMVL
uniref:PPC domain-containing protein n=1 Tax=Candidatus Methanogaster sp. ANME-2c ERB4 TaxID=2759911 RepID=A0A7G9YMK6_9EURY|nr:hypothetical protein DHJJDJHP_00021 [Methanosarcinales archaeon ANME-2c ERB4]QNO49240.1 hypothetical protein LDNCKMAD_00005 [Methanosarcinales archaeon ANME-2c ERB4]